MSEKTPAERTLKEILKSESERFEARASNNPGQKDLYERFATNMLGPRRRQPDQVPVSKRESA